ncbi:hypothetical protein MRX96_048802 [Rhipicephalus microplus]
MDNLGEFRCSCDNSTIKAREALEAQVAELDKAGQAKTAQLVRTVAELDEAREKQAQLEKRVEELVTPAAGDDASARAQNNERHAGGNADPQGVTDAARTSGVRQRRADSGNKESPEAAPGSVGSPARSLAAVVNHSSPRTPAKVPAKDQRRRQVIVVGDSNMARVGEVIKGRVGDDERVKVSKLPGKRVGEVMQQAKEQLWDRMEDRSLVVVMGGVNDALQGRGGRTATTCEECIAAVHSDELTPLIKCKRRGGLVSPSRDVISLCKEVKD